MNGLAAFIGVTGLFLAAFGAAHLAPARPVMAFAIPASCALASVAGIVWRVMRWAHSPVPFRIPVTGGQQHSFAWLRPARIDNPSTTSGAIARMTLEMLVFRSLLRNAAAARQGDGRLAYRDALGLWAGALAFHYALLVVVVRHLRFFLEPVPAGVKALAALDGFFEIGAPVVYASSVALVVAIAYLLVRRITHQALSDLSLVVDYAAPLLLLAIAVTGLLLRHVVRADSIAVKEAALGLFALSPSASAASLPPLVLAHITMASVLVALLPFTKLMHAWGVWLSPTRNLANNSRAKRHVNPWNAPVAVHSYAEWEGEFRDKLMAAGMPVENQPLPRTQANGEKAADV